MDHHHHRHHHHHRLSKAQRKAVRVVQILAILLGVAAIADFSYMAYATKDCFTDNLDPFASAESTRTAVQSSECQVAIARRDLHMRFDGLAVILAIGLLLGAGVALSRAHRRTKRLVLGAEAAALVLILAYSLLWIFSWH